MSKMERNTERKAAVGIYHPARLLPLICLLLFLTLSIRGRAEEIKPATIENPGQIDAMFEAGEGRMFKEIIPSLDTMYAHHYAEIVLPERGWLIIKSTADQGPFTSTNARSVKLYLDSQRFRERADRLFGGETWYLEKGCYYLDFSMAKNNGYTWYGYFLPDSAAKITIKQELSIDKRAVRLTPVSSIDGTVRWKYAKGSATVYDVCNESGDVVNWAWAGWENTELNNSVKVWENGTYSFVALIEKDSKWYSYPVYCTVEVTQIDSRPIISFDSWGGSEIKDVVRVASGARFGTLPEPKRSGYQFGGWYTGVDGRGEKITASSVYTGTEDITLYAFWKQDTKENTENGSVGEKKYVVTFKANGGKAVSKKLTVKKGGKYGTLPKTTRKGYKFSGWYTKKKGGSRVTASTKYTASKNTVLYAHWKKTAAVKLSKTKLMLQKGKTAQLKVSGSGKKVVWKTSNSKVASVKNGKVTAKKAGSATITATVNGKKLTCRVTVRKKK